MIVHEVTGSPVSGFFHLSHRPAELSSSPSAALMKYGGLPSGPSASRWTAGQSVTRLLTLDYCVANNQWSAKNTFAVRWRFCSAENEQVRVAGSINRWSKLSSRQSHPRCSSELECDKSQRNKLEMNNR